MIAPPLGRAAVLFAESAMQALATRPEFRAALCGGPQLTGMLQALHGLPAFHRIDWRSVQLFAADDGWDEASSHALFGLPLPRNHLHRPRSAEVSPVEAAWQYEHTLRAQFGLQAGGVPVFDLVLLDAAHAPHVASASDTARLVVTQPRLRLSDVVLQAAKVCEVIYGAAAPHTTTSSGTATPPTARAGRTVLSPT